MHSAAPPIPSTWEFGNLVIYAGLFLTSTLMLEASVGSRTHCSLIWTRLRGAYPHLYPILKLSKQYTLTPELPGDNDDQSAPSLRSRY